MRGAPLNGIGAASSWQIYTCRAANPLLNDCNGIELLRSREAWRPVRTYSTETFRKDDGVVRCSNIRTHASTVAFLRISAAISQLGTVLIAKPEVLLTWPLVGETISVSDISIEIIAVLLKKAFATVTKSTSRDLNPFGSIRSSEMTR